MPGNDDHRPGSRHGALHKGLIESPAGNGASEGLHLPQEHRVLQEIELAELRRLAEEGKASGLSEEDGEALIDRLEAKYRGLVKRESGT